MSEFRDINLPQLIERGVPPQLAQNAIAILEQQNAGELPCPLEGEELHIVHSAFVWMQAQASNEEIKL
jgi:hypothetical protein